MVRWHKQHMRVQQEALQIAQATGLGGLGMGGGEGEEHRDRRDVTPTPDELEDFDM